VSRSDQALWFNAVPLLAVAAAYLGASALLVPALRGRRPRSQFETGILAVFPAVGLAAAVYGIVLAVEREAPPGGIWLTLGLAVVVDPDLREKNWGNWEGLTSDERLHIEFEGETSEAHRDRTLSAVQRIVERHPGERVVVVTHGGSLRRIQAAVSGFALPVIENCAVWGLAHEDGRFRPID
jgi:hypothetical protein